LINSELLDFFQPREQAKFWRGYSTMDHLQSVNQIIEKAHEYKIPLYFVFIDYAKAFDLIEMSAVFQEFIQHTSTFSNTFTVIVTQLFE